MTCLQNLQGTVMALTAESCEAFLRLAPKKGADGRSHLRAVIGACGGGAKTSTVLTFNAGDFTAL